MTPLAAKLFRSGDESVRMSLARSQFFECTALFPMVREMVQAEVEMKNFSEFAQLPAPETIIELNTGSGRMVYMCRQEDADVHVVVYIPGHDGRVIKRAETGFRLGTADYVPKQDWVVYPGEKPFDHGVITPDDRQYLILMSFNTFLEATLRMINQPGLVGRKPVGTHKAVVRDAAKAKIAVPAIWHECRIRPGQHVGAAATDTTPSSEPIMPLHYVRKYFKPSSEKWVDGYWRGDIALGLHLKWYSPQPVVDGSKAASTTTSSRATCRQNGSS